jgi:Cu(I)/Ag(I) efflux system membrane protein CusA/SilA
MARLIGFFVESPAAAVVLVGLLILGGLSVSPFDHDYGGIPRDRVPVDAIPDVGENQQIVFTEWPGRSPRDVEDQVTYPLTTALLGMPGVRTVRSSSMLGFSTIYVIFEDDIEFYWARSRVLEKLAALSPGTLPPDATPTLGPDATALGQVFWYTLEGHDEDGEIAGGWSLHELRALQDFTVRYALQSVPGVSEVASVGGHVREYQVDVDPEALAAADLSLTDVLRALRGTNLDVGARTLEVNRVEYLVRGLGLVEDLEDLETTVIASRDNTPIRVRDVGHVALGPAPRRGILDDSGAEVVGGVVVVRYGDNPMEVIERIHAKIEEIAGGLPERTLEDGRVSKVTIVPFYDRSELIQETLATLSSALWSEILIALLVVLVMLRDPRSATLVAGLLPLGVLGSFLAMKAFGVDANVMALSGIAIAIGTMVDMGIVIVENIRRHLDEAGPDAPRVATIRHAAAEVAPAVLTSTATTVVSFLPVFGLTASEGKLFTPLAATKTFALIASFLVAALILPPAARLFLRGRRRDQDEADLERAKRRRRIVDVLIATLVLAVTVLLARDWGPLGPDAGIFFNALFVLAVAGAILGSFAVFRHFYERLLRLFLANRMAFLVTPILLVLFGALCWLGTDGLLGWLPEGVRKSTPVRKLATAFPGLGHEYMPPFDEGAFLYMPTTMPHASLGEAQEMLSTLDAAIAGVPEVDRVVGKLGRADSALDPAPVSMIETLITFVPEYGVDEEGNRVRQWRDHIETSRDIWDEIVVAASLPGLTSAPFLQPISTRIVMLQSGMRAPMGLKIRGPDLESIEAFAFAAEDVLKEVPQLRPETVFADRVVGKPYLEIDLDREALGRYGLTIEAVQRVIQTALGGQTVTRTVEGRERFEVRVRYLREERDSIEAIGRVRVSTPMGDEVPLEQLATLEYVRGPQVIKSEDSFPTAYVLFDKVEDVAEVEAVEAARARLEQAIDDHEIERPAGVTFDFAGTYENQVRSQERLSILVPVTVALVFMLLYLQFRRSSIALAILSGVAVAISGGIALLWLWGHLPFVPDGIADLMGLGSLNLSVAVWVGFIALIGIATDDGVIMATYIQQRLEANPPGTVEDVREETVAAGKRRIRPCLMTIATTLIALLPVIMSTGRGGDVMAPMAIPIFGGMSITLITLFVVPLLYSWIEERRVTKMPRGDDT